MALAGKVGAFSIFAWKVLLMLLHFIGNHFLRDLLFLVFLNPIIIPFEGIGAKKSRFFLLSSNSQLLNNIVGHIYNIFVHIYFCQQISLFMTRSRLIEIKQPFYL